MTNAARSSGPRSLLLLAAGCACVLVAALAVEFESAATRESSLPLATSQSNLSARLLATHGEPPPAIAGASSVAANVQDWTRIALARPLFSPSRRPAAVATTGPQQPRLTGIVLGPSGNRAIFAGAGDSRGIVAGVGQQAGDWHVLAIDASAVRVMGPMGVRTLRPTRDPTAHDDTNPGGGFQGLPAHPSILDLLRSRPLRLGPSDLSAPPSGLRAPPPE